MSFLSFKTNNETNVYTFLKNIYIFKTMLYHITFSSNIPQNLKQTTQWKTNIFLSSFLIQQFSMQQSNDEAN